MFAAYGKAFAMLFILFIISLLILSPMLIIYWGINTILAYILIIGTIIFLIAYGKKLDGAIVGFILIWLMCLILACVMNGALIP